MTNLLYVLPWILWVLWFIAWEAWGFRKGNDKWPTLSQLVKWWEARQGSILALSEIETSQKEKEYLEFRYGPDVKVEIVKRPIKHGIAAWSWRRWVIAVGLPVFAILLELHWVWELF